MNAPVSRVVGQIVVACLVACTMTRASAQDVDDAAMISPYLDDAAIAVVVIDLKRLDLPALARSLDSAPRGDATSVPGAQSLLRYIAPAVDALREFGATKVFAVYSLHDVTRPMPYLVIPAPDAERANRIAGYLLTGRRGNSNVPRNSAFIGFATTRGKMVLAGNQDLPDRLDAGRIPDLILVLRDALAEHREAALRIVGVLTSDQRRVLAEMFPSLPKELGELSAETIAHGLVSVSAGIDPAQGTIQCIINTSDSHSAQVLAGGLSKLASTLAASVFSSEKQAQVALALAAIRPISLLDEVTFSVTLSDVEIRGKIVELALGRLGPVGREATLSQSLKQVALAMHLFHDTYGSMPPPASYDAAGKPLLSWRVYVLPYLDQDQLYRQFHLDEPWDSPHNRELIPRMPEVFSSEHLDLNEAGKTTLQLPVGEKTPFHGSAGMPLTEITDGTVNTIMLVTVPRDRAVVWTQPEDFSVDVENVKEALFAGQDTVWTALCDGAARALPSTISEPSLKAAFTARGGEPVEF